MKMHTLQEIAEISKAHKQTPDERRAQRISLMMGLRSNASKITREQVSNILDSIEGVSTTPQKK